MKYSFDDNTDIYTLLQQQISSAFEVNEFKDQNDGLNNKEYRIAVIKSYIQSNLKNIYVILCYSIAVCYLGISLINVIRCIIHLDTSFMCGNLFVLLFSSIFPFGVWMYSTTLEYWSYHNRKMFWYAFSIIHLTCNLTTMLCRVVCLICIPYFSKIQPNEFVSITMIKDLNRLVIIILSVIPMAFFLAFLLKSIKEPMNKTKIIAFKLDKIIDLRSRTEKEFSYDMTIVKNLETGTSYTITEKDRFLHSLANGTTGTGKTSSLFTNAIHSDLSQIAHNLEYQKKKVQEYLHEGRIQLVTPFEDIDFSLDHFAPVNKKDKNLLNDLKYLAKLAGITAMAPNAAFSDEIYQLVKANGLKVNRLDPTLNKHKQLKEGFRGFNPLYINPDLDYLDWVMEVNKKAVLFADVAQAVYDASGQSDVYFASLNKNITTTITTLVLLTYPFMNGNEGKQPTPIHIQEILNNFTKAQPYFDKLIRLYAKRNAQGKLPNTQNYNLGMFQPIYDVVKNDILGDGAATLYDQCRGLRNIINSFLQNPLIRNILCTEDSIDLDKCLENGEITIVNYALELGSDSIVFGLFFMLSFINAVLRRPGTEKTRLPHFTNIDEFPVLIHPKVEACFSLFRQYRVAMFVAIQSLSQMEKSKSTAFLKPILMGNCAHHFVFGRVAVDEMKMYQELAGTSLELIETKGETYSSIIADNPTVSYSKRVTTQLSNNMEGSDLRYRDFQEVTVLSVVNGSPINAFAGRSTFLPNYKRIKKKRYEVNWNNYCVNHTCKPNQLDNEPYTPLDDQNKTDSNMITSSLKETIASDDFYDTADSYVPSTDGKPAFLQEIITCLDNNNDVHNDTNLEHESSTSDLKEDEFTVEITLDEDLLSTSSSDFLKETKNKQSITSAHTSDVQRESIGVNSIDVSDTFEIFDCSDLSTLNIDI